MLMARDKIHVGLEVGTSKVAAVVAECRKDGEMRILGVGESPSRGVRKGEIIDFATASQCVRDALEDAEERSDYEINKVWLAMTGSHIKSFSNRGSTTLEEETEITDEVVEHVEENAKDISLPKDDVILHSIIQRYYVDGREGVIDPIGLFGKRLEAEFHIIHGVMNRIHNTVRCVKELDIEVEDIVVNSIASAQVVLDEQQKRAGVVVIDIGGGTTDYIAYHDGAVLHSGVIAVGGDHITNDLCIGLKIPLTRAEKLKIEQGAATLEGIAPDDRIVLKNDTGFSGKVVERMMLNEIIHYRLKELFTILRKDIGEVVPERLLGAGILLTGGCSLTNGIREVAESVFEADVHLAHARQVSGPTSAFVNPRLSTCIGVTKFAQAVHTETQEGSLFGRLVNILTGKPL